MIKFWKLSEVNQPKLLWMKTSFLINSAGIKSGDSGDSVNFFCIDDENQGVDGFPLLLLKYCYIYNIELYKYNYDLEFLSFYLNIIKFYDSYL